MIHDQGSQIWDKMFWNQQIKSKNNWFDKKHYTNQFIWLNLFFKSIDWIFDFDSTNFK